MNYFQRMIWRLRYTIYGQYKTRWGLRLWWGWSSVALCEQQDFWDDIVLVEDPISAAHEEIYAAIS